LRSTHASSWVSFLVLSTSVVGTAPPPTTALIPFIGPAAGGRLLPSSPTRRSSDLTTVRFGTNAATGVSCATTTSCSATSPAGSGDGDGTRPDAGHTNTTNPADQFTYLGPPVGVGTYEDTNPAVTFSGAWTSWPDGG